jgi:hypothetical protein
LHNANVKFQEEKQMLNFMLYVIVTWFLIKFAINLFAAIYIVVISAKKNKHKYTPTNKDIRAKENGVYAY